MFRLWLVIGFLATVFYVYSIVNVSLAQRLGMRGLPKAAWIAVVVIFPFIGAALWYSVGRGGLRSGRVIAPDDDPEFLATLGNNSKSDDNGADG
ncbi:PLD nuclease N-terminal domain-containing protein [Gryllotalpicola reticulitermitis]|uniref:PLD nuclease N-terminal domain-containing protein n=1 Tax=Gryllotalpicola reticulitermitis TaxID=1184153 RepID=A0ABV8Q7F5_9MICO